MAIAVVAAFAATMPAAASAAISSTVDAEFGDPALGAHSDYSNLQTFDYTLNTLPYSDNEDLRKWIIDAPAGQIGNPNQVPFATRCTEAQFTTVIDPGSDNIPPYFNACPPGSKVGIAGLVLGRDDTGAEIDGNGAAPSFGYFTTAGLGTEFATTDGLFPGVLGNATPGTIYLLQTDPEFPVTLGTFFHLSSVPGVGPIGAAVTRSDLAPVTSGADGDFRIRVTPREDVPHRTVTLPGPTILPLHIVKIMQHLNGYIDPDAASINQPLVDRTTPFTTNPTRCADWDSYSYATAYANNSNADSSPVEGDGEVYKKSAASTTSPDCTNPPSFAGSLDAKLSTTERASNPQLDVVVTNSNAPGGDVPKDVTVTLPGAVAADIDAIAEAKLCSVAQRDTDSCPAASKVGTVKIETPFLSAGLTGNVFMVKKDGAGLPNISIFVDGAIKFRLDGITNYVGPEGAQIETKLTNLPQVLFSKFTLTIDGGKPDSLLVYRECKTDGAAPTGGLGGPITSSMTGYTNAVVNGSQEAQVSGCYGTPKIKSPKRCVRYKLAVTPRNMLNSPGISKVELYVGKTKRSQRTRLTKDIAAPWKLQKRLGGKFKRGKTYYMYVKTTYKPTVDAPSGKVLKSKVAKFKRCR